MRDAPPEVPPAPPEAEARLAAALDRHGLVLVQGQRLVPSLADLLADAPVTTRGFSWDYVPAWTWMHTLAERPDLATTRLVDGAVTVVHRRLWPAVDTLAREATRRVAAGEADDDDRRLLLAVEAHPGRTGERLKADLDLLGPEGTRRFKRARGHLEPWCCVIGRDQEEPEVHTHDHAFWPWPTGKIATHGAPPLPLAEAYTFLAAALAPDGSPLPVHRHVPLVAFLRRRGAVP